jgi:hypothetical protein
MSGNSTHKSRSQIGKSARRTGHDFERAVVRLWKERFKDYSWSSKVRRTDQGHKAHLCDVWGVPGLWQELGINSAADPKRKMAQALKDLASVEEDLVPLAVLRPKKGKYEVHIRFIDFLEMIAKSYSCLENDEFLISMDLNSFMDFYESTNLGKEDKND